MESVKAKDMTYTERRARMDELSDIIDAKRTAQIGCVKSFRDWEKIAEAEIIEWSQLGRLNRLEAEPDFKPHDNGDLMTLTTFIECVQSGGFIDYDGSGEYATPTHLTGITIRPSDIAAGIYRSDFSHVMWYNK